METLCFGFGEFSLRRWRFVFFCCLRLLIHLGFVSRVVAGSCEHFFELCLAIFLFNEMNRIVRVGVF